MESTQIQALYEPPLAAMPQLSEKPRQGFETWKTAWNQGSNSCNFTVTLGLQATVVENGVRETYSARYYNPNTGRFMSRDPEAGKAKIPASLHKYLYANGDPVNGWDPTGRDWLEYKLILKEFSVAAGEALIIGSRVICGEIAMITFIMEMGTGGPGMPPGLLLQCKAVAAANAAFLALLLIGL
jgi:RHS repeat-associated protein